MLSESSESPVHLGRRGKSVLLESVLGKTINVSGEVAVLGASAAITGMAHTTILLDELLNKSGSETEDPKEGYGGW